VILEETSSIQIDAVKCELPQRHIENRRLFDAARGRLRLGDWEHEHVHECRICEGVLCVMVSQVTNTFFEGGETPADAA
jgi:hypothetical protein